MRAKKQSTGNCLCFVYTNGNCLLEIATRDAVYFGSTVAR